MPKQREVAPLIDIYDSPTGVQDAMFPDEPDDDDLEADRARYAAAKSAMRLMPDFVPGLPDDGDPGDEDDSAE